MYARVNSRSMHNPYRARLVLIRPDPSGLTEWSLASNWPYRGARFYYALARPVPGRRLPAPSQLPTRCLGVYHSSRPNGKTTASLRDGAGLCRPSATTKCQSYRRVDPVVTHPNDSLLTCGSPFPGLRKNGRVVRRPISRTYVRCATQPAGLRVGVRAVTGEVQLPGQARQGIDDAGRGP